MAKGDHVYVNYDHVDHHGIDCGDGTVIHYPRFGKKIERISLRNFSQGRPVNVRRYPRGSYFDSERVVAKAKSRLGENKYNVFSNNCEHFASWCKTGEATSGQVKQVAKSATNKTKTAPVSIAGTAVVGHVANGLAREALNPVSKVLVNVGLQEAPKVVAVSKATLGVAGVASLGGIVTGVATEYVVNRCLPEEKRLSRREREAREAGRNAAKVGTTVGGIGGAVAVAAMGGGAVAIGAAVAAPVVLGAAAATAIYHLWKS